MPEHGFRVWVGGWRNSRQVSFDRDKVAIEVARISCSHCTTCSGRIHYVENALRGEGERSYVGGGVIVSLPYPESLAKTPAVAAAFLSGKLGLSVSPA
jgi:hypothetical protein